MKKASLWIFTALVLVVALAVLVSGRVRSGAAPEPAGPAPAAGTAGQTVPAETAEPQAASGRQDGERFEDVIILEGMEETVRYEHIVNAALGFEMDYDYENFVRGGTAERERFVSDWDDPGDPENYLELTYIPQDAGTVAAAVGALLSNEYEISRDDAFQLARAGRCIRIDASEVKGGGYMPDKLQAVYVIPAADGCRVAAAHYAIEGSEGFGRRFRCMMDTLTVIAAQGEKRLSAEQALSAVRNYCLIGNPELAAAAEAGEYPAYWEIASSDEKEIVILYRSYTGALVRYHIDPVTGEASVTEQVPGIMDEEQRTDERLNVWAYSF